MVQHTGHKGGHHIPAIVRLHRHIDVHSVAAFPRNGLGAKIGIQAVVGGNGAYHGDKMHGVVGSGKRIAVAKINLVLAGALLVVRGFGRNGHTFQRQADFAPHILAPVGRRNIHVGGTVKGLVGGIAVFVGFEKIKLKLGAKLHRNACRPRLFHGILQQIAAVEVKWPPIGMANVAEHTHHLAAAGPPRHFRKSGGNGKQKQIRFHHIAKARNGRGIKGNALRKGTLQLVRHNRKIALPARKIAEGEANELYIFLFDIRKYVFFCVKHSPGSPLQFFVLYASICVFYPYKSKKGVTEQEATCLCAVNSLVYSLNYTHFGGRCQFILC